MAFQYPTRIDFSKPPSEEIRAAIATQNDLHHKIVLKNDFEPLRTIAGVDVGYDLKKNLTKAVVAVFAWPTLELQTSVIAYADTHFPYIAGLLAFREIPAIQKALSCLKEKPSLLMVDGQGIAHPRRMGIAAHLGVVENLPAIGVGKSRLCGRHDALGFTKLEQVPLIDKGEMIGTVLRSKEKCNPLFISAGHRVDQQTALEITKRCISRYRLPEPTRIADQISKWALET